MNDRAIRQVLGVAMLLSLALPAMASAHRGGVWVSPTPYWGWGWGGAWGSTVVYPMADRTHGALDVDVEPERAQIYIDGELVGEADDYDGFPDFLWLERGTYDVVLFHAGFQTIARQISVYAGQVIDVEDRMVPGTETLPEDLISRSTVRREERLRRDRENEDEVRRSEGRYRRDSELRKREVEVVVEEARALDARSEPGRARLAVSPDDASVYLDGRFLGTGRELARLRSGLIVDPGEHRLEVVRPGRRPKEQSFSVNAGEEIAIAIDLEEE